MQRDETSTFTKFFDPTIYSTQSLISNQLPFTTISQTETVFNSGPTSSLPLEFSQNQHWNIITQQQQQQSQLLSQQTISVDDIKPDTMTNTNDLEHGMKSQSRPFSIVSDRQQSDISPSSTLSANNDNITNCIDKPLSTISSSTDNNSKEILFS